MAEDAPQALISRHCNKCGGDEPRVRFYASSGGRKICVSCTLKKNVAWQKANPDKVAATHQRYLDKVPGRRARRVRATLAWQTKNRGRVAAIEAGRKAAKLRATPSWANQFFIEEAYDLAQRRTKATGIRWEVDHIVPLRSRLVCGLHVEHNLCVIPKSTNAAKGNRFWPDMP